MARGKGWPYKCHCPPKKVDTSFHIKLSQHHYTKLIEVLDILARVTFNITQEVAYLREYVGIHSIEAFYAYQKEVASR